MTRCKIFVLGLLLVHAVCGQQYSDNPYLNGYRNDEQAFIADQTPQIADNPFLQHAINARQILDYQAPQYLPPVERQQLICSGPQVCVPRNLCQGGYYTQGPSPAGGRQNCDINSEVCCQFRPPPPPPPPPPTPVPSTPCTGNNVACVPPNACIGGVIRSTGQTRTPPPPGGKCYAPEVCCRVPEATVLSKSGYEVRIPDVTLPTPTRPAPPPRPPVVPSYLPPVGTRPPIRGEGQLSPPIFPEVQPEEIPLPTKCAAALNCTRIEFCSATGVITKTPVVLTKDQELFRVPLTDCMDEKEGFIGKCCRDSEYVDPWPVTQLGRYDASLFGDDGKYKPTGNNGKPRPPPVLSGSDILSLPIAPSPKAPYQYPKPSGQCADRNKRSTLRGEGPYDAAFGEYPWQAMILLESTKSLLCGGAIIRPNLVATAAHCVIGRKPYDVLIKAGEWKLGRDEEPLPFELMRVTKIIPHPNYDSNTLSNDMALLHLENNVKLDAHVTPICIEDGEPTPSDECVTTGWGKIALKLHAQDAIMHHSKVSILPSGQCSPHGAICGKPGIDACELDPGSALACISNGKYVLKGVFSSENQCGDSIISFTKADVQWINGGGLSSARPQAQSQSNYNQNNQNKDNQNQYSQNQYSQNQYSQNQYNPNQYSQYQYSQNKYNPNQYSQNQYSQTQYNPNQYSQSQYRQNQYGQNQYGQSEYDQSQNGQSQYNPFAQYTSYNQYSQYQPQQYARSSYY